MRAGDLDREIQLQTYAQIGSDPEYNTPIVDWTTFAGEWAKATETPGREYLSGASQEVAERKVVFTIRWRSDVGVTDRVIWEGEEFDIENLREVGRREGLELHCRAIVDEEDE
jgi:SPP1 family predicted phage head-tail adaptor